VNSLVDAFYYDVLDFEMRRLANSRLGITRCLIAALCIACTGTFAAVRGAVRADALAGPGWMAAAPDQHVVPARTPTVLGLLRYERQADARGDAKRFGFGGALQPATSLLLALHATSRRTASSLAAIPARPENRAPYHATAPPALP
jgi:hypothetical protein